MQCGQHLTLAHRNWAVWHKMTWKFWQEQEKQARGSVLSDQHRNSATQSDNRKTHSHQTNCLTPGLPLSPLFLSSGLWKGKNSQKVTSLDLHASVVEWVWKKFKFWKRRESVLCEWIRFEGWRWAFCEVEPHHKRVQTIIHLYCRAC